MQHSNKPVWRNPCSSAQPCHTVTLPSQGSRVVKTRQWHLSFACPSSAAQLHSCSAAQLLSCSAELRRCVAAAWLLGFSRPRPHSASRTAPPKLSPPPSGPASRSPAHRREGPAEVTRRIGVRPLRGTPGDRGSSELKTKVRTSEN